MAEQDQPETPQFNYFRMKKAYYDLGIHQQLGLSAHSLFLALLHKANSLHFPRFIPISGKELADLAVLSERSVRAARDRLVKCRLQGHPVVLYWSGDRRRKPPTFAIIYEQLDLEPDPEKIGKRIDELNRIMEAMEEFEIAAMISKTKRKIAASNAAKPDFAALDAAKTKNVDNSKKNVKVNGAKTANDRKSGDSVQELSTSAKLSGTTRRKTQFSGTTRRDHNIGSGILPPLPINNSSIANIVPENGEEGGGVLSKREKTEEEIQDIIANLAKHGVKNKKVATGLAKKYTTSFIYRHIMQINRDHRAGQKWKDPGGILVSRIRKEQPPPDFPSEEYPEAVYAERFGGRPP